MLQKFEFSPLEYSLFLILKSLTNYIHDIKVLFSILKEHPVENEPNSKIMLLLLDSKFEEINEINPLIIEKIKNIFILDCSLFLNFCLKEEALFPLFRKIMEYFKDFNYELFELKIEIFLMILKEKRYEMLKFLIEKKEIRLEIPDEKEININLLPKNYNDVNKSNTFKKCLTNNAKIGLQMVVLYYISESHDHYIVKYLFFVK